MTTVQMLLTIGAVVLGTMTTRFLPFLIFIEAAASPRPNTFSTWEKCCPMR